MDDIQGGMCVDAHVDQPSRQWVCHFLFWCKRRIQILWRLLPARRWRLELSGLLRGGMLYKHHPFRNALHFQQALNAEMHEYLPHCTGNRFHDGVWSRDVVSPQLRNVCQVRTIRYVGTCLVLPRVLIFGMPSENASIRTPHAHVDSNLAGLLQVSHANTALQ